jgi:hypothetical protein
MLVALTELAHNVLIWARHWLVAHAPRVRAFGLKRLVGAVFDVREVVERAPCGEVLAVVLNQADPSPRTSSPRSAPWPPRRLCRSGLARRSRCSGARHVDPSAMSLRGGAPPRAHAVPGAPAATVDDCTNFLAQRYGEEAMHSRRAQRVPRRTSSCRTPTADAPGCRMDHSVTWRQFGRKLGI